MNRQAYIVTVESLGVKWVVMWRPEDVQVGKDFQVYGPYASEAEATDNLEGEPNPELRIFKAGRRQTWACPACGKTYPTYAAAKCCREIPIPR